MAKAEGLYCELPQTIPCGDLHILIVISLQQHLPVSTFQVKCRKPLHFYQLIQGVIIPQEQESVLCDVIQLQVLHTVLKASILLDECIKQKPSAV
jgi:hypothetical protein